MQNLKYRNTRTEQPTKNYKTKVIWVINFYIGMIFTQIRKPARFLKATVRQKSIKNVLPVSMVGP